MYGKKYPILDALILLPSVGFPAIAEKNKDGNYEIFVSMLCITTADKAKDFVGHIPEILGIEEFKTHLNSDLEKFSSNNITKFPKSFIGNQNILRLLTPQNHRNKVFWLSQEGFIEKIKEAYKDAYGKAKNSNTSNLKVHHIEFMLTLPKKKKSGLYNLICKYERESYKRFDKSHEKQHKPCAHIRVGQEHGKTVNGPNTYPFRYLLKNMIKKSKSNGPDLSKTIKGKPVIPYHPVYIPKDSKKYLNIAHISDTHVARRWNAMEHWANIRKGEYVKIKDNWKDCSPEKGSPWDNFNNPNRRFEEALQKANKDSNVDIIIITGDLIDYNMGYCGDYKNKNSYFEHGIESYYNNYNWGLFYELLLKNYKKPVFTILGNHDYRLAPYGVVPEKTVSVVPSKVFDASPSAEFDISPTMEKFLDIDLNYADDLGIRVKDNDRKCFGKATDFIYPQKMRKYSSPKSIKTSYENVKWYNLVINPALDYMFTYGDMGFVFLDWHREEEMLELKMGIPENKFGLPWAKNMLTEKQEHIIEKMIEKLKNKKKNGAFPTLIVSMHPTVFCEPKMEYYCGCIVDDKVRDDDRPTHLARGNFKKCRLWFIEQMYAFKKSGGRAIVLSGHAHKNRLYAINIEDFGVSKKNKNDCDKYYYYLNDENKKDRKKCEVLNINITNKEGNVGSYNPLFIVTTSSAYISKEANSPGFRILAFEGQKLKIKLISLTPIPVAVLPLLLEKPFTTKAKEIVEMLKNKGIYAEYDESGSIKTRYRRFDEIGTPFCITVDKQTFKDNTVAIRDKDTKKQVRVKVDKLPNLLNDLLSGEREI